MFHEGEVAVQSRAGVAEQAARVGRIIRPEISPAAARLLDGRPFAIIGAQYGERLWAGLIIGTLAATSDGRLLTVRGTLRGDALFPLHDTEKAPKPFAVGVLVIDFATRRRIRVNGIAQATDAGFEIAVEESYNNCPQHISAQPADENAPAMADRQILSRGAVLPRWIEKMETFFIASHHPSGAIVNSPSKDPSRRSPGGADVSHRGGHVRRVNDRTVEWDDYDGNTMFNTLGNLQIDDRAGLLWIDWAAGRTVQASGRAHVTWSQNSRAICFEAEEVVESTT